MSTRSEKRDNRKTGKISRFVHYKRGSSEASRSYKSLPFRNIIKNDLRLICFWFKVFCNEDSLRVYSSSSYSPIEFLFWYRYTISCYDVIPIFCVDSKVGITIRKIFVFPVHIVKRHMILTQVSNKVQCLLYVWFCYFTSLKQDSLPLPSGGGPWLNSVSSQSYVQ